MNARTRGAPERHGECYAPADGDPFRGGPRVERHPPVPLPVRGPFAHSGAAIRTRRRSLGRINDKNKQTKRPGSEQPADCTLQTNLYEIPLAHLSAPRTGPVRGADSSLRLLRPYRRLGGSTFRTG